MNRPHGIEGKRYGTPHVEAHEELLFPKTVVQVMERLDERTFRVREGKHIVTVEIENAPKNLKGTFVFCPHGVKTVRAKKSGSEFIIRYGVIEKGMQDRIEDRTPAEQKHALEELVEKAEGLPDLTELSDREWMRAPAEAIFGPPIQEAHHEPVRDQAVGVVVTENGQTFVRIDKVRGKRLPYRVELPEPMEVGTLVLLSGEGRRWEVVKRLGRADNVDEAITALAYRAGINPEFSERVQQEAEEIGRAFETEGDEAFIERQAQLAHFEYKNGPRAHKVALVESYDEYDHGRTRLDLRGNKNMRVCAIDPKKGEGEGDRDDLMSYEDLGDGVMRIGIHIADVDHFAYPGTALDAEASERQSTGYLPGHVIPMLPPILTDQIVSLEANKSRLAQSIVITVYPDGRREVWHGATVVKSEQSFSYPEADKALTNPKHPFHETFVNVKRYCDEVRAERKARGALTFDERPEMRVMVDKQGRKRLVPYERAVTSYMIEDLAITASEAVGQLLIEGERPGEFVVFERVNVPPPLERLASLLKEFYQRDRTKGATAPNEETTALWLAYENMLKLPLNSNEREAAFNALDARRNEMVNHIQERVQSSTGYDIGFAKKMAGALMKMSVPAYYTLERGIGHSGLAAIPYPHFTSPGRRRADIHAKRLRDAKLRHEPVTYENEILVDVLSREANLANEMRVRIKQAERDAERIQVLDILKEIAPGTEYSLSIQGYAAGNKGVTVVMPLPRGGTHRFYIPWRTLIGDKDPREFGASRVFRPGEKVKLRLMGVDFINRNALFEYAGTLPTQPPPERPVRAPKQKPPKAPASKPARRTTRKPRK